MQTKYQELAIFKYGFELCLDCYDVIAALPACESHNIADQMRRASTSLPLNVAEGAGSISNKMFINHLHYAYSSAQEIEVMFLLCLKLKYIDENMFNRLYEEVDRFKRALYRFTVNLERKEGRRRIGFLSQLPDRKPKT